MECKWSPVYLFGSTGASQKAQYQFSGEIVPILCANFRGGLTVKVQSSHPSFLGRFACENNRKPFPNAYFLCTSQKWENRKAQKQKTTPLKIFLAAPANSIAKITALTALNAFHGFTLHVQICRMRTLWHWTR